MEDYPKTLGDLEGTSRAEEYERFAHLLMANLNALPEGVASVDLNGGGPSRGVQNVARYTLPVRQLRHIGRALRCGGHATRVSSCSP